MSSKRTCCAIPNSRHRRAVIMISSASTSGPSKPNTSTPH
ncbi:Uncharacterised protein [Vibrio cholerae]|nr:Uncharacterised protein [Vibrio cholerae]